MPKEYSISGKQREHYNAEAVPVMNWIPKLCFGYGVVSSIVALIWHSVVMAGYDIFPTNFWAAFPCLVLHGIVMMLTFHQRPSPPPLWAPVLMVSSARIRTARMLLFIAGTNFLVCSIILIYANRSASLTITAVLSSLILLHTIYIAIHWGFRPENLFSPATLVFFSNPIHYMISPRRRAEARRRKR